VVYLAAVALVVRLKASRSTLPIILLFAGVLRLAILFSPPHLSTDIYRYIWDGRVQASGVSPYRYIPDDPALAHLRDERVYPNINRRDYAPTIYPPVAQMIFLVATRIHESVSGMKAVMVGFELVTMWALMQLLASFGQARHNVVFYAWHPLIIWETAGSGHLDAAVIAFVALALLARRRNLELTAGAALAAASLIKFVPIVLLPALYRRWGWKLPAAFAGTVILTYLPYVSVGSRVFGFLHGYWREEGLVSGERYFGLLLVREWFPNVPATAYLAVALAILLALALWSLLGQESDGAGYLKRALTVATAFTVLLSPRYAWYFCWVVPFLCFGPTPALLYLTVASPVLYGLWVSDEVIMLQAVIYVPFALLLVLQLPMIARKLAGSVQPRRGAN
jgi:hypothetical protein